MSLRSLKTLAKRGWHRSFRLLQHAGINLLPEHFYSAVPNLADLERRTDWRRPRSMHGIAQRDIDAQVLLGNAVAAWRHSPAGSSIATRSWAGADGGYGEIEAEVLFGFVATNKPRASRRSAVGQQAIRLRAVRTGQARHRLPGTLSQAYCVAAARLIRLTNSLQTVAYDVIADPTTAICCSSIHACRQTGQRGNHLIQNVAADRPGVWVTSRHLFSMTMRDAPDGDVLSAGEFASLCFSAGNSAFDRGPPQHDSLCEARGLARI